MKQTLTAVLELSAGKSISRQVILLDSDEILAQRLQRGERAAVASLVERHYDSLAGFLYRLTGGDRMQAEDLAQETFLRVLRAIHTYQTGRRFKPWLYAIALNLWRDACRRSTAQRTDAVDDDMLAALPGNEVVKAGEEEALVRAVRSLPPGQREAVILRYCQDLSLAEIAEALGVPTGTIKSRLSLGLKRLKAFLEADDGR